MTEKRKWHGTAVYRVVEVITPYNEICRGLRVQVALPNMNGRKPWSDEYTVSFRKPYLVYQSSDYNDDDLQEKLPKHVAWLLNRGFERVLTVDEYLAVLAR